MHVVNGMLLASFSSYKMSQELYNRQAVLIAFNVHTVAVITYLLTKWQAQMTTKSLISLRSLKLQKL